MITVIQRSLHIRDVPQLTFVIFTWTEQITEELNFVQKLDVVSLNYKLAHNIETLKTLQIKDRIEFQVGYQRLGRHDSSLESCHEGSSSWGSEMAKTSGRRCDFTRLLCC